MDDNSLEHCLHVLYSYHNYTFYTYSVVHANTVTIPTQYTILGDLLAMLCYILTTNSLIKGHVRTQIIQLHPFISSIITDN